MPVCTFVDPTGWECPKGSDARYRRGFREVHRGPLCDRHYVQIKRANTTRCAEPGCGGEAIHFGRCRQCEHLPLVRLTEAQRDQLRTDFLSQIRPDWETGCWVSTGPTVNGYGRIRAKGAGLWLMHRLSWHLFYRPHESGTAGNPVQMDHLCERVGAGPACCNPLHLRPATAKANRKLTKLRADPSWDWKADVRSRPRPLPLVLFALRNGLPLGPDDSCAVRP